MKTLQITEVNARKLHKTASAEFRTTLEDTFGKQFFETSITDRIKTVEDAYHELGMSPIDVTTMKANGFTDDEIIYRNLKIVTMALNEGWVVDWGNSRQHKYVPYFSYSSGFAFYDTSCYFSNANVGYASRLCFKTRALAEYAGKQFVELYRAFIK